MTTKIFDAVLGLIKLSHNHKNINTNSKIKEKLSKAVLYRICELTVNPSENTEIDLSILLNMDLMLVRDFFGKYRSQRNKKSKNGTDEENDEMIDIPATVILQILYLVRDSLNGRSRMRNLK